MANSADTTYGIIREATVGVIPATPALKVLDTNSFDWTAESTMLASDVMKANRAAGDTLEQQFYVTGSMSSDFRNDPAIDMILEGGFGGTFASKVLKAGSTDLSHTIEAKMLGTTTLYTQLSGNLITSVGVKVDAASKAEFSSEFIGLSQATRTAIVTGATYVAPTQGPLIGGGSAGSITISGITGTFYGLDLKVGHSRAAKFGLFNQNAFGISTGANRTATLTLQLYRDDFSPETVFAANTPVPVSFTLGTGTNSYTFSMARCFAKRPKRETQDNNEIVTIELTAVHDGTALTDITCTKG